MTEEKRSNLASSFVIKRTRVFSLFFGGGRGGQFVNSNKFICIVKTTRKIKKCHQIWISREIESYLRHTQALQIWFLKFKCFRLFKPIWHYFCSVLVCAVVHILKFFISSPLRFLKMDVGPKSNLFRNELFGPNWVYSAAGWISKIANKSKIDLP